MRIDQAAASGTTTRPPDSSDPEPEDSAGSLLPDWYMPSPMGGPIRGWRRTVALVVTAAFLLITAYGLCNTYGDLLL